MPSTVDRGWDAATATGDPQEDPQKYGFAHRRAQEFDALADVQNGLVPREKHSELSVEEMLAARSSLSPL
eukprot:Skav220923  [mRNA]  locus=scaffold1145:338455:339044:+ [translate_table: standard]